MIDNDDFVGFLVYSMDPVTNLHIGLGMFPTYYILSCYNDKKRYHELGFKSLV